VLLDSAGSLSLDHGYLSLDWLLARERNAQQRERQCAVERKTCQCGELIRFFLDSTSFLVVVTRLSYAKS